MLQRLSGAGATLARLGLGSPPMTDNDVTAVAAAMASTTAGGMYHARLIDLGSAPGLFNNTDLSSSSLTRFNSSSVAFPGNVSVPQGVGVNEDDIFERPFPCKFCEARFKKKQHLQNHERIHTGEKYVCVLCGQGFSRLHILKHHVMRKHNDRAAGYSF